MTGRCEAIRQLDAEGYVTIRPNRGAVVTSRTPEQVVELFEMRAALEGLAMGLSVPHVTDDAIEDLKLELARLRRLESNAVAWVDRHDQFHDMICQLSHRPRLCADITRLRLAVKPYLRLYIKLHAYPEIKGHEHEYILEALQSGDGERAERVMREHVMVNAEAIASCLPAPREEPTWHPAPRRAAAAPRRSLKRQVHRQPKNTAMRTDSGR